ncbi:anti-virulence regulator CigR family protein [Azospirillum sp. sgz301742]
MTGCTRLAAVLGLAVALGAGPALAEKGGQGKGHGHGNPHDSGPGGAQDDSGGPPGKGNKLGKGGDAAAGPSVVVTTSDRTAIQNYFIANPVGVSPLPPGIAKNVARGKPLPPGIAKKQAPPALVQQVAACRNGLECIVLGADMLILDAVHGVVRDIVRNVVR